MNRGHKVISLLIVTVIILGSLQPLTMLGAESPEITKNSRFAYEEVIGLLPDPDFNNTPEVVINGSSTEFDVVVMDTVGDMDKYVELRWNHTANTALDFVGQDPDMILPDYNDFVYVYQEFDWPYNDKPHVVDVYFNYSTYRTGDFADGVQNGNNLMFRIFIWAIDSSGNWTRIYESRDATYTEEYQIRRASLNYLSLTDIFQGMVEIDGVQQDPEDKVKLAIGLAPTWRFMSYDGTEPWTYYNGEVNVRLTSCEVYAYVTQEDDPDLVWQPEYNVTYGTTLGEEFPTHENASLEIRDYCQGLAVSTDGSVYVSGNTISPYDLYLSSGIRYRNQYLLKYSPDLNLQWAVKNDNGTQVRSMTFYDDYIFTTGYVEREDTGKDLIITKWSSSGVKLWESEWIDDFSQVGVGIAVGENGSSFVVASDYDNEGFPGYWNTSILKFDNNGDLLWNRRTEWVFTFWDARGDLYLQGNYLYFSQTGSLTILNLEGEFVTGGASETVIPDGNDGLYTAVSEYIGDGAQIVLSHTNATGYPFWNTTYARQWINGRYQNFRPVRMSLTPEDTLLVLALSFHLNYYFALLTYDLQGNLLNNRTISNDKWQAATGGVIFMDIGNSGLGYFAFDIYNPVTIDSDLNIQAFEVYQTSGGTSGGFTLTVPIIIMITSGVVIIGAIAGIFQWKRRRL